MIKMSPTQNGGRLIPNSARLISARSSTVLARAAAATPIPIPRLNAMSIAAIARMSVPRNRSATSLRTGRWS